MEERINDIFIEFKYNGREIDGVDDFWAELNNDYLAQGRSVYIPSFSEGGETWFTLFINSGFFEFAKDVIVYVLVWDLLKKGSKKYFLKPFFEALKKLNDSNENSYGLRIQQIGFQFDDIEILFGGIDYNRIAVVSTVFNEIAKRHNFIENTIKLSINKIETPIYYNPSIDKKGYSQYFLDTTPDLPLEQFVDIWKVWFMDKRECKIYKLKDNSFIEAFNQ